MGTSASAVFLPELTASLFRFVLHVFCPIECIRVLEFVTSRDYYIFDFRLKLFWRFFSKSILFVVARTSSKIEKKWKKGERRGREILNKLCS